MNTTTVYFHSNEAKLLLVTFVVFAQGNHLDVFSGRPFWISFFLCCAVRLHFF